MKRKYKYKRLPNISDYIINFLSVCCIILLIIFAYNKFLHTQKKSYISEKVVSAFQMPYKRFLQIQTLSQKYNIAFDELLTVYSLENNFFPNKSSESENEIEQSLILNYSGIKKKYSRRLINQYASMFKNIFSEIKYFPIPADICNENDTPYIFRDSWEKNYRDKIAQGCDIFDRENISGRIPIVSMTAGEIKNVGWDELLGYNISIRTSNNNDYLYCHLEKFAEGLEKNSKVNAGDLIGFMGDTKKEDAHKSVHLHLCINPKVSFADKFFFIDPYLFLRFIETKKITLVK